MRLRVKVSGIVFALLALAHVARMFMENRALARDPARLVIIALAARVAVWACASARAAHR